MVDLFYRSGIVDDAGPVVDVSLLYMWSTDGQHMLHAIPLPSSTPAGRG